MGQDLTVLCVYWGDKYHRGYVYALKDMVEKYLTIPHEFRCITTEKLPGIQTIKPYVPYYGWWQKIGLFAPRVATGPTIYLDLDVVITQNIDYLADYTNTFSAPANWAQSGHGGIQSSVMAWPGNWTLPLDRFNYPVDSERLWGDQEFLWELLGDDWQRIPHVGSYKYHCRAQKGIPQWMRICVFHGLPNPHEISDNYMHPYIKGLKEHVNDNQPVHAPGNAPRGK